MTNEEAEIEHLMTVPPKPELTVRDKIERGVGWLTAVIAVAGLTIAIIVGLSGAATAVEAKTAAGAADHAIACINEVLGSRAGITSADNADHIAFADLLLIAVTQGPVNKNEHAAILNAFRINLPVGQVPSSAQLVTGIKAYATELNTHQAARDSKPLGMC